MKLYPRMLSLLVSILFASAFAFAVSLVFAASVELPREEGEMQDLVVNSDGTGSQITTAQPQSPTSPSAPVGMLDFSSNGNGTCTVLGIGTYTSPSVVVPERSPAGDRVTAIAPQAFYGENTITAVHIPATVGLIGNLAFAECQNLAFVSVSDGNSAYRAIDGVLYSADLSVLILYPPMRASEDVTVYVGTTVIREMAFYHCTYLKRIRYTGSPSQWEKISIGTKNYALLAVSKEFGCE